MNKCAQAKALATGIGIVLTFVGAVVIAWFDAFAKFDGQPFRTNVPMAGIGHTHKTPEFQRWERKRERAVKVGLALAALGTAIGLFALAT